jgi:hypothetical protein
MYQIIRFYSDIKKQGKLIKTVRTLAEAQAHCRDPKTRKEVEWFDGYQKIK